MAGEAKPEGVELNISREWRQGDIIHHPDARKGLNLTSDLHEGCLVISLSHTCDMVNPSLVTEPFLEVVIARPVEEHQFKSEFREGRHQRQFQFEAGDARYEIKIQEKSIIKRDVLIEAKPDIESRLSSALVEKLVAWVGKRYVRPAFPDEFHRRIRRAIEGNRSMHKLMVETHELFRAFYIRLKPLTEELSQDESYELMLWGGLPEDCT